MAIVTFILSGTTTWTVPVDWNNSNNSIECIGGGGGGKNGNGAVNSGGGGGGGAYSASNNLTYTPGHIINLSIGAAGAANGGSGGDTSIQNDSNSGSQVLAKGGVGGAVSTGGSGGSSGSGIGNTRVNGGNGGAGGSGGGPGGGGGGGAGGNLGGAGVNGSDHSGSTGGAGGAGDNGSGGAGGAAGGGTGSDGTEWQVSPARGSGGGGGGGSGAFGNGGAGGNFGGGGGGGGQNGSGAAGTAGIIVITYTPADFTGFMTDVDNEGIPVRRDLKRFHAASAQGLIAPILPPAIIGLSWFFSFLDPVRFKRGVIWAPFGSYAFFPLQPKDQYTSWLVPFSEPVWPKKGFKYWLQRHSPDITLRRVPSNIMTELASIEQGDVMAFNVIDVNLDYAHVSIIEIPVESGKTGIVALE